MNQANVDDHFGLRDRAILETLYWVGYKEWRTRWIEKGMPWDSAGIEEPPPHWDPHEQLKRVADAGG